MKFGVLGIGTIAVTSYGYIPGMLKLHDVELIAACDPVPGRAEQSKLEWGFREAYTDLTEMLAKSDVETVVNLTPIPLHGSTCIEILKSGRHLIVEKPIATTMKEADEIIRVARQKQLTVVVAPPSMLHPNRQEAKRLVAEGAIGKIAFARVRSSHGGPAAGSWPLDPTWFYQKGSGPLFDMGVYGIHDITGILGPAKRVVAMSGITEPVRYVRGGPFKGKAIEVTADDNTLFMLDFGGSTFAVVDGTFNVNAAKSPQIEIFGRAGTINIPTHEQMAEPGAPMLEIFRLDAVPGLDGWISPRTPQLRARQARINHLQRGVVVEHFLDCVRDKTPPILSAEHARHALEIMLKAVDSARAGKVLELETTFTNPSDAELALAR